MFVKRATEEERFRGRVSGGRTVEEWLLGTDLDEEVPLIGAVN